MRIHSCITHGLHWQKSGYSSAELLHALPSNHCDYIDYRWVQDTSAGNSSVATVRSEIRQLLASPLPSYSHEGSDSSSAALSPHNIGLTVTVLQPQRSALELEARFTGCVSIAWSCSYMKKATGKYCLLGNFHRKT